jgi:hypothetical protein
MTVELEVVMTCKFDEMEYTPALVSTPDGHNIPLKCVQSHMPETTDPQARWEYVESIKKLLGEVLKSGQLAAALDQASAMANQVQSPFAISIRLKK